MEAAEVASWMFAAEVPIPADVNNILIPGASRRRLQNLPR